MKRHARQLLETTLVAVLAVVLLGAAVQVQAFRERHYPSAERDEDELYVTSPVALRRLTVPFNALAADLYWIRAIQHYGGQKRRLAAERLVPPPPPALAASADYDQLYPLLSLTTALDPRFDIAYRFGAVFLAEAYPSGPDRPELAIALLDKGIHERPDKWEYMEDIGFVHYWYRRDYKEAAAWFDRASKVPGAPLWLKPLAASTLAQGGDRRSSKVMWEAIRGSADVEWLRREAERRLLQFQALDQMDALQAMLDRHFKANPTAARDWGAVIRAKVMPGVPVDPGGAHYELSPEGRARLSPRSPLFPLPSGPEALTAAPAARPS